MIVLGWVLAVACGIPVLGFFVWLTIQDWRAVAMTIVGVALVTGSCYGLHLIGVIQ